MEIGVRLDGAGAELAAACCDGGIERIQRGEMLIGDRLADQRPKMLGRL